MPKFQYKAYTSNGKVERGELETKNKETAIKELAALKKNVFWLGTSSSTQRTSFQSLQKKGPDLIRFFEDFSELISAGLKADIALKVMSENSSTRTSKKFCADVLDRVNKGENLSNSLSLRGLVPRDILSLIEVGEETGNLQAIVPKIAKNLRTSQERKREFQEILTYPIFLIFVMLLAVLSISVFLVPAIEPLFEGREQNKPTILAAFAFVGDILDELFLVLIVVLSIMAVCMAVPSSRLLMGKTWSRIILKFPFVGKVILDKHLSRFLTSLAEMVTSHVSLERAIQLATESVKNNHVQKQLKPILIAIKGGQDLSDAIADTGVFSSDIISIVSVGDRVNRLGLVLARAAELTDRRSERKIKTATALITPLITVAMGILIGALAYAVMSALLSINELAI